MDGQWQLVYRLDERFISNRWLQLPAGNMESDVRIYGKEV